MVDFCGDGFRAENLIDLVHGGALRAPGSSLAGPGAALVLLQSGGSGSGQCSAIGTSFPSRGVVILSAARPEGSGLGPKDLLLILGGARTADSPREEACSW